MHIVWTTLWLFNVVYDRWKDRVGEQKVILIPTLKNN